MAIRMDETHRLEKSEHEEPLTATEARQATLGRPILIVLLAGLVIAMLVWIPADWWGRSQVPDEPRIEQSAPSDTTQMP